MDELLKKIKQFQKNKHKIGAVAAREDWLSRIPISELIKDAEKYQRLIAAEKRENGIKEHEPDGRTQNKKTFDRRRNITDDDEFFFENETLIQNIVELRH